MFRELCGDLIENASHFILVTVGKASNVFPIKIKNPSFFLIGLFKGRCLCINVDNARHTPDKHVLAK